MSQDVFGSSHIFRAPGQVSAPSPRSPGSFDWRMVFRNEDVSVLCAYCYRVLLLGSLRGPRWEMYVGILNDTYIHAYTEFTLLPWILIKHHKVISAFHLSIFVTSFLNSKT